MNIGKKIRMLRLNAHLTEQDLAIMVHVEPVTVVHWENGRMIPTENDIIALANAFHVSVDDIKGKKKVKLSGNPYKQKVRASDALKGAIKGIIKLIIVFAIVGLLIYGIYMFLVHPEVFKFSKTRTITCTVKETTYKIDMTTLFNSDEIMTASGDKFLLDKIDLKKHPNFEDTYNLLEAKIIKEGGSCKKTG